MAPTTRMRSKTLHGVAEEDDAQVKSTTNVDLSPREGPTIPHGAGKGKRKRRSTGGAVLENEDDATQDSSLSTPARKKLSIHMREEADDGDGHDPATTAGVRIVQVKTEVRNRRPKRSRSNSVADPQDDDAVPESQSASRQLQEEAIQRLASQCVRPDFRSAALKAKEEEKPTGKAKHVVFGDEDDLEKYVAVAADEKPAVVEKENEEELDEAPEAVSTKAAAREALESAKVLAEATEKQAALVKWKRQNRDSLFKQQAQKRNRVPKPDLASSESDTQDQEATREAEGALATTGRRRVERLKLPGMLPAEYLTESSSEDEDGVALKKAAKKPKKINFEDALQSIGKEIRVPRDQVVGSTVYRVVAGQADKNLAPKMHKNTRYVKEDMLRRRRAPVTPNKKRGFFVAK
ncbi:hypothetical protein DL766_007285 [Monosporascus sp. MC13-8B]|uniref:Uncharacterized protein n=1 Tax=Monosporascus cannonballus TaxID=155416 RepID=A0ABY0GUI3_9PEZI|nr:hypothetical protein DL762_009343 [Monosporascus cannonballus]RYP24424.1 hypothetical protein DL766_007285 [Monosporascus sp. MC13-8B]